MHNVMMVIHTKSHVKRLRSARFYSFCCMLHFTFQSCSNPGTRQNQPHSQGSCYQGPPPPQALPLSTGTNPRVCPTGPPCRLLSHFFGNPSICSIKFNSIQFTVPPAWPSGVHSLGPIEALYTVPEYQILSVTCLVVCSVLMVAEVIP